MDSALRWLSRGCGALLLLLLVLPIVTLIGEGIEARAWLATPNSNQVTAALWLSLTTTSVTTLLAFVLGTPLAYWLAHSRWSGRRLVNVVIELPIVMPPAVAGLALLLMFGRRGWLGAPLNDIGIRIAFTVSAVVLAQLFVAVPFYVRAAQVAFREIDQDLVQAARVDGASDRQVIRFVVLPLARRGLLAGLILCWARAAGEFGATALFAGSLAGARQTLPLLVYNMFERDLDAAIWTGILLIGAAFIALMLVQLLRHEPAP